MTLNQSFLTEKEFFRRITRMVEHSSNSKIKLSYLRGENYCQRIKEGSYRINIATPSIKGIPKYTALIHELSHILFKSPFVKVYNLLDKWDLSRKGLYFQVFNVLEDQRVESHIRSMYLAYNKRFDKTLNLLGKDMRIDDKNNPVSILLAIRFKNESLVEDSINFIHYKNALKDVEKMDSYGALRILISIKKYIDEYKMTKSEPINANNLVDYAPDTVPQELSVMETDIDIEEIKSKGREKGNEEINRIERNVKHGIDNKKVGSIVFDTNNVESNYNLNYDMSNKIKRILNILKLKEKTKISNIGYDLDVQSYINNLINGHDLNESFIDDEKNDGFSVVVSVDASASMNLSNNIANARDFVSTLFHAVKDIDNIELKCNLWSSNNKGMTWIRQINSLNDCKQINVDKEFPWTPTHIALKQAQAELEGMKGKKKMVFLVTDGDPYYIINGVVLKDRKYLNICKRAYLNLLSVTPNVFCFLIHRKGYTGVPTMVEELFSNKTVRVGNMQEGTEKIIKQFKRIIELYVNK